MDGSMDANLGKESCCKSAFSTDAEVETMAANIGLRANPVFRNALFTVVLRPLKALEQHRFAIRTIVAE